MSNNNFQAPLSCGDFTEKAAIQMHEEEEDEEGQNNISPAMTDSQSICPGLNITTAPQQTHSGDTDAQSSGIDSTERENDGRLGRGTSTCSSLHGKGSATETTESKRYGMFMVKYIH